MVPLNYIDAAEFCETSGSKVGWISLSDAQGYANDIFDGNITGQPLTPPFIFWTGIVRIDDLNFQNDTEVIKLDAIPESEFWSTTTSGNGFGKVPSMPRVSARSKIG